MEGYEKMSESERIFVKKVKIKLVGKMLSFVFLTLEENIVR